jgi:hypothetical protein
MPTVIQRMAPACSSADRKDRMTAMASAGTIIQPAMAR